MTEKQKKAKELLDNIVTIQASKMQVYHDFYKKDNGARVCWINDVRYIIKSDLNFDLTAFLNNMMRKGKLTDDDFLHGIHNSHVTVFVKAESLLKHKDEMMTFLGSRFDVKRSIADGRWLCKILESKEGHQNYYPEDMLKFSEDSFKERLRLIAEAKKERLDTACAEVKKAEEVKENTLEELVRKIEAMGWDVTLKLKKDETTR